MNYVLVDLTSKQDKLSAFAKQIQADVIANQNGEFIAVNNNKAQGTVRFNNLNNGLSVISLKIILNEDLNLKIKSSEGTPSHLLYTTKGHFSYFTQHKLNRINRYQNVIIGATDNHNNHFVLPKNTELQLSIINVEVTEFLSSRMQLRSYIEFNFHKIFAVNKTPYCHFGGYSLKIADELNKYWSTENSIDETQNLKIEGHILLMLSRQLLEYKNFNNKSKSHEFIEAQDIDKIKRLTQFIEEHIGDNITITTLVKESGIHPKKLQTGFKMLYSKSINEFVRELKLKIAVHSLENSNESISEIVYKIGFKSRSYFSKIFLEKYGILPIEFKRKMNKKKINQI